MNKDLKIIKKKYGEDMMHLCRSLFPTILESDGKLSEIMLNAFAESRELYHDIVSNNVVAVFTCYINHLAGIKNPPLVVTDKTPEELLKSVGYDLYWCKSNADIEQFRKFYRKDEVICTFNGHRFDTCFIFFAVKENALDLKRADFIKPDRQDEYGTSVISIQFTRGNDHHLSIKNRYNHHVLNADATFSNNLDNIVPGLTESFARSYGMRQKLVDTFLEIPGYVKASDNKYYKYNYMMNYTYYSTNNVIIYRGKVKHYEKEKYVVMDYYLLDLVNKRIDTHNEYEINYDCFIHIFKDINNISINKYDDKKEIIITTANNKAVITLNKLNQIIAFYSDIDHIKDNLFINNTTIEEINLPNVVSIGDNFLKNNSVLNKINIPKVEQIGNNFLENNLGLNSISLPNLKSLGNGYLSNNKKCFIDTPKLSIIHYIKSIVKHRNRGRW